jgi:hypothetical protein
MSSQPLCCVEPIFPGIFQYQENWQSLASLILFATNGQLMGM